MRWFKTLKESCLGTLLFQLVLTTIQGSLIEEPEGEATLDMIMSNQASLLQGDIDGSSKSHLHFAEVKSELERSSGRKKQKSGTISNPLSETRIAKRMKKDESSNGSDESFEMADEKNDLDFLIIHLQPHHLAWKNPQIEGQYLGGGGKTNNPSSGLEEGEIEEGMTSNTRLNWSGVHHGYEANAKDSETNVITHQSEYDGMPAYPSVKVEEGFKSSKDELIEILADLKDQGKPSGYMNVKVPTAQLKRLVELEQSMRKADWNYAWSKICASFGIEKSRYWVRSVKAQVHEAKLIEGWKVSKKYASKDLKLCMELIQAEEYWPVYSGIKNKTFEKIINLINKMRKNRRDHKELGRLIPPFILQNRLSRMSYMAQRPEIISDMYPDAELKLKQEQGYDTLWIMMIEEALYTANQLGTETSTSDTKEKKSWDVFAKLFRMIHEGDIIDDRTVFGLRKSRSAYWYSSMESNLFTCGTTPQSHRFQNGFKIALKSLQSVDTIYRESLSPSSFSDLMRMAGDWSLSDILLGIHHGVNLKTFHECKRFANSDFASYDEAVVQLEKGNLKAQRVFNFKLFLKAHMELQKEEGKNGASYRPLKSLRVI
ncbi:hypothetical protein DFH28DRAFT_85722 [Melampsora americana]|nr:hypothetical protein DFH28DRAFT_85722 [Melampsora americana]